MTSSGIEPAIFLFVAQHLNHCAAAVPREKKYVSEYKSIVSETLNKDMLKVDLRGNFT